MSISRRKLSIGATLLAALALALASGPAVPAGAAPSGPAQWVQRHAVPLATVDPSAPLRDIAALRGSIGDARVVGLGESVHGAAEELTLKHRVLRLLVERMGFRSIAWEEDWSTGVQVDEFIRTGQGDVDALVSRMEFQWQSREVADVLRWLRDYNRGRENKVRFVGLDYYLTGSSAYNDVESYIADAAPDRLDRVRRHLRPIRPSTPDIYQYIEQYRAVADKQPFIDDARAVWNLVDGVPHRPGDRRHELALHTARQIVSFYEHFSLSDAQALVYRDAHMAENLQWWQELTGDRVAFWAASPHTANAPDLRIATPPSADLRFASAGSYLRHRYGRRYLSIGFTFDHGAVSLGGTQRADMPAPPADWFEWPLGRVPGRQFAVDLRASRPPAVRGWLTGPIRTRGLPDRGPQSFMDGGTAAQWFDVVVHRQTVTPARPVSVSGGAAGGR